MHHIFIWSQDGIVIETQDLEKLVSAFQNNSQKIWLDMEDPTDVEIDLLLNIFHFHPTSIEDVILPVPVPKVTVFDDYVFLALHRVFYNFQTESCEQREFEVFLSEKFIVTVHDKNLSRAFATARQKVHDAPRETLGASPSLILIHLLKLAAKDYQPVMEQWQENLEEIEQSVLKGNQDQNEILNDILKFKKLVATMRKSLLPEREVIHELYENTATTFIPKKVQPYLKGAMDDMQVLLHDLESLREHAGSVFDVYAAILTIKMTQSSNQLNFIMQRLTIAATIFLPLTFIVGVYGMNFPEMPEYHWKGFYYLLWGFMASLAAGMVIFFRKKKWI